MIKCKVRDGMIINIKDEIHEGGTILELPEDIFKNHEHLFEVINENKKTKDKDS